MEGHWTMIVGGRVDPWWLDRIWRKLSLSLSPCILDLMDVQGDVAASFAGMDLWGRVVGFHGWRSRSLCLKKADASSGWDKSMHIHFFPIHSMEHHRISPTFTIGLPSVSDTLPRWWTQPTLGFSLVGAGRPIYRTVVCLLVIDPGRRNMEHFNICPFFVDKDFGFPFLSENHSFTFDVRTSLHLSFRVISLLYGESWFWNHKMFSGIWKIPI